LSIEAIVWVFRESKARGGARMVLTALADYAHPDGTNAWPKIETLALHARMSERGVQKALRRLEDDGEIVCTGQSRSGSNVYAIVGMALAYGVPLPGDNAGDEREGGERGSPPGANSATSRGERRSPELTDDPSEKKHVVEAVTDAWGKHAPPLIRHPAPYFKTKRFESAVLAALRTYELDAVTKAIENYARVLASPAHYWSHRYSAVDFLRRERATPGVEKFVDEALPLENFRTKRDDDRDGRQQRTPAEQLASAEAWILNTAWRQPIEEWDLAEQLGQRGVEGPDRERLLELWRSKRDLAA
jgi:hypothetical protein